MFSQAMFRSQQHAASCLGVQKIALLLQGSSRRMGLMQVQMIKLFHKRTHQGLKEEEPIKTTIFEEARIGQNVHPAKFEKEKIMSNIDPDTMLKKQQNLEFQDLP